MKELSLKISFVCFIISIGIVIGVYFVSPYVSPRYEIHNIIKLNTWTGETWIVAPGGWKKLKSQE